MIFIMPPIIREFSVSVIACMRCHAYMPMAHADGDADGYKLSLRLTPTIYVAIVPCI